MNSALSRARRGPAATAARTASAATVLLVVAICACGGDDGEPADAGPPADARPVPDAALVACSVDAGCDTEPLTPVCDLERGVCVECISSSDCERAGSFGPACDETRGYCRCERDEDCEGNRNGPYCHEVDHACTCLLDQDCGSRGECELEPYLGIDVRTCRQTGE